MYSSVTLRPEDSFDIESDSRNMALTMARAIGREKGKRVFAVRKKVETFDTLTIIV